MLTRTGVQWRNWRRLIRVGRCQPDLHLHPSRTHLTVFRIPDGSDLEVEAASELANPGGGRRHCRRPVPLPGPAAGPGRWRRLHLPADLDVLRPWAGRHAARQRDDQAAGDQAQREVAETCAP